MVTLEDFMSDREENHPVPDAPVERVMLLAKELALGVHNGYWQRRLSAGRFGFIFSDDLKIFLQKRWGGEDEYDEHLERLYGHGYLEEDWSRTSNSRYEKLSRDAFALLSEAPPFNVFISYTHEESSAFALLLVTKLQHYGIQPFCDMSLVPGEDWHPELEKQIKKCKHFIVLIGKETRNSSATVKEVEWALENDKIVIPIWHNEFEFNANEWDGIEDIVINAIQRKHAVIVQKESAAGYNAAIVELLTNRFGVTP